MAWSKSTKQRRAAQRRAFKYARWNRTEAIILEAWNSIKHVLGYGRSA